MVALSPHRPFVSLPLRPPGWLVAVVVAFAVVLLLPASSALSYVPDRPSIVNTAYNPNQIPYSFTPNQGQTDPGVSFIAKGLGGNLYFTQQGVVLDLPVADSTPRTETSVQDNAVLRMEFADANAAPTIKGATRMEGRVNYFFGNDPTAWNTNIPTYNGVTYQNLYDGIDLRYDGTQGRLKGTFTVQPGTDPGQIRWAYAGATNTTINPATGDLEVTVTSEKGAATTLKEQAPVAWQLIRSERRPVTVEFSLYEDSVVGFALPKGYDTNYPLILDPTLEYGTYIGGSGRDIAESVTVDRDGYIYVSGTTYSINFPSPNGRDTTLSGQSDAFVVKLKPDGTTPVYSTYIGGGNYEGYYGPTTIAVDNAGYAFITGSTSSSDYPTVAPLFRGTGFNGDTFLTKLSPLGNALMFSTYVATTDRETPYSITLDHDQNVYIAGVATASSSLDFPLMDPLQGYSSGGSDAFVMKFDAAGSKLLYSTFIGGTATDVAYDVAVDWEQNIYLTGSTLSKDFPTVNPIQATNNAVSDSVFVTKIDRKGHKVVYSTYLGGTEGQHGLGIAVNNAGEAAVMGVTLSNNFPTLNPWQPNFGGGRSDAFVSILNADGRSLKYSTYVGGTSDEVYYTSTLAGNTYDQEGNLYVAGYTDSANFPLANSLSATRGSGDNAFVLHFKPNNVVQMSTTFGADHADRAAAIAVGEDFRFAVVGQSDGGFPMVNPYQNAPAGSGDAMIAQLTDGLVNNATLEPRGLTFPETDIGVSNNSQGFLITNIGTAPLDISTLSVEGRNAAEFAIDYEECSANNIPAGESCVVNVRFTPSASGTRFARITVGSPGWSGTRAVNVRGRGATSLEFTPGLLNYGYQKVNTQSQSQSIALTNIGSEPLEISTVVLQGANPDDYILESNCVGPLQPVCAISVRFRPTSIGGKYARVEINGPEFSEPVTIPLSGKGGDLPTITASDVQTCIGEVLEIKGTNWPMDEPGSGTVKFYFGTQEIGSGTADALGGLTGYITIPETNGGNLTLTAKDNVTGATATLPLTVVRRNLPIIVVPGASGSVLEAGSPFAYLSPPNPNLFLPIPNQLQWLPQLNVFFEGQYIWLDNIGILNALATNYRFLDALRLEEDGLTPAPDMIGTRADVEVGDVLWDVAFTTDLYGNLRDYLVDDLGYTPDEDLFYYPYDWRKGTQYTADGLNTLIKHAMYEASSDQVIVIAHSMGGLVTRNYMLTYGAGDVNQLITLGTPYLGSTKAGKVLEVGDSWGIGFYPWNDTGGTLGIGMHPMQMQSLAQNFSASYQLLPSEIWFEETGRFPDFDPRYLVRTRSVDFEIQATPQNYAETRHWFASRHNALLMDQAQAFFDRGIADMSLLTNQYTQQRVVGINRPTQGILEYSPREVCVTTPWGPACLPLPEFMEPSMTYYGDNTVPERSASGANWVNNPYVDDTIYYVDDVGHVELPGDDYVQTLIGEMVRGRLCSTDHQPTQPVTEDTFVRPEGDDSPLVSGVEVVVYGTAEVQLKDAQGRITGTNPDHPFSAIMQIPGVGYDFVVGAQVLSIPSGGPYTLTITNRVDEGMGIVRINRMVEGQTESSMVYPGKGMTAESTMTLTLNGADLPADPTMTYKLDAATPAEQLEPVVYTGDQAQDTIPPTATITNNNGTITITAVDNPGGVGVDRIYYRLNDNTVHEYTGPFALPPFTESLTAIAVDKAGNGESAGATFNSGMQFTFMPLAER